VATSRLLAAAFSAVVGAKMATYRAAMKTLGLGSKASASLPELKVAYREQAKRWHPDVAAANSDAAAAVSKFREVQQAYELLAAPGMSHTARMMTRSQSWEERNASIREYHAKTSGRPIKVMMYMLLALTGGFAADLAWKKRFRHQRVPPAST
jgi:hypothetical protein